MNDDLAGFAEFYDATLPQVYRYVAYRVADTVTAEDLTSAIFESALRAWKHRRKPEALMPWLFRIARNTVISHYRRDRHREMAPLEAAATTPGSDANPEQQYLDAERHGQLQKALRALSEREQDLIALKIREIAEANDIPVFEDVALARSMYNQVSVDNMIPPQFYQAVAELVRVLYTSKSAPDAGRVTP